MTQRPSLRLIPAVFRERQAVLALRVNQAKPASPAVVAKVDHVQSSRGSVFGCDPAQDGSGGTQGTQGAGGSGGNGGSPGTTGESGGVSWNMTSGPEGGGGGGGDVYGYEPGMPEQYCTPWYWVSFHCEYYLDQLLPTKKKQWANHARPTVPFAGWQCVETGRSYIGCF